MDSSHISGLIGGVIAVILASYVVKSARGKVTDGELRHGAFILILGLISLAMTLAAVWGFFYDNDARENASEFYSIIGLFIAFGTISVGCFGEYFAVNGSFNDEGIALSTPWTGAKKEKWDDLESASFNSLMYWYTLTFKSGTKIRLSSYLHGHGEVLAILNKKGYEF